MSNVPNDLRPALTSIRTKPWTDERHRRVRRRLNDALSPERSFWRMPQLAWGLAALGLLVVVGAGTLWRWQAQQAVGTAKPEPAAFDAIPGSEIGSTLHETKALFADGSSVEVALGGKLGVMGDGAQETRLELTAGRAQFNVQKRPQRPFIVSARGVEVRVIGTRFEVELDGSRELAVVRVIVMRGVVEVRKRPGAEPVRLTDGEHLDVTEESVANAPALPSEDDHGAADVPPETAPSDSVGPKSRPMDASQLFEAASSARQSGDVATATRMYARLLKQYPGDQRASVAALELGRLMMDTQRDYGSAANAFRRAVAAAPNEALREDALARLVWALDAMHDGNACQSERGRYLARYPRGVHASSVQGKCGGR